MVGDYATGCGVWQISACLLVVQVLVLFAVDKAPIFLNAVAFTARLNSVACSVLVPHALPEINASDPNHGFIFPSFTPDPSRCVWDKTALPLVTCFMVFNRLHDRCNVLWIDLLPRFECILFCPSIWVDLPKLYKRRARLRAQCF